MCCRASQSGTALDISEGEIKVITISHSHAEGTLISGTSRGDGSAEVLKSMDNPYTARAAWRWSRNLGAWYVQRSRDARANTGLIDATKTALEAKGFSVAVEIDDTYRSAAEVEADKIARQEDRVTALQAKAERKSAAAEAAWEAERRAVESLPEGGEPIHGACQVICVSGCGGVCLGHSGSRSGNWMAKVLSASVQRQVVVPSGVPRF